jgi:hypothetical protein
MKSSACRLSKGRALLPVVASTIWFWNFKYEKRMEWLNAAGIEIHSDHIVARDVNVVVQRIAEAETSHPEVLEVRKATEDACALGECVVQPAEQVSLMEGIGESA